MSGFPDQNAHRRVSFLLRLLGLEKDLCLVPEEPLPRQCAAGAREGHVSADTARKIYHAMIAADEQDY